MRWPPHVASRVLMCQRHLSPAGALSAARALALISTLHNVSEASIVRAFQVRQTLLQWDVRDPSILNAAWVREVPWSEQDEAGVFWGQDAVALAQLSFAIDPLDSIEVDPRVAYLHLACQVAQLRASADDERVNESLVSLADCMGMQDVKNELGDSHLAASNRTAFNAVRNFMTVHEASMLETLAVVKRKVKARYGVHYSRIKAIHSIHHKMARFQLLSPYQVLDILAIRIVVHTEAECYAGAEWATREWAHVGVKDYIAAPKPNGYRSLHVLIRASAWTVEMQFRTKAMHMDAECGHASHALYKASNRTDSVARLISALHALPE